MPSFDLFAASATQLARKIRERELSSVEVIDAYLDRIASLNPLLNAVARVAPDSARERFDLIVCPVEPNPATVHGVSNGKPGSTYTAPFSLTGWPCAVVRAGTSPEGMPIGVPWRRAVAGRYRACRRRTDRVGLRWLAVYRHRSIGIGKAG